MFNLHLEDIATRVIEKRKSLHKYIVHTKRVGCPEFPSPFYFSQLSLDCVYQLRYYDLMRVQPIKESHFELLLNKANHIDLTGLSINNLCDLNPNSELESDDINMFEDVSRYEMMLIENGVISEPVAFELGSELGFLPKFSTEKNTPFLNERLRLLGDFLNQSQYFKSYYYAKGVHASLTSHNPSDSRRFFDEGARVEFNHECIAMKIIGIINNLLVGEKWSESDFKILFQLFARGLIFSGIITEETHFESNFGFIKLLYIILDIFPLFRRYTIDRCKVISTKLLEKESPRIEELDELFEKEDLTMIQEELIMYPLVELNLNNPYLLNSLKILEYLSMKPGFEWVNLYIGDLYCGHFMGISKIDIHKRLRSYSRVIECLSTDKMSAVRDKAIERTIVIYIKLYQVGVDKDSSSASDDEIINLYMSILRRQDDLKHRPDLTCIQTFLYEHYLYFHDAKIFKDSNKQSETNQFHINTSIVHKREESMIKALSYIEPLFLQGLDNEISTIFWIRLVCRLEIGSLVVNQLKENGFVQEFVLCNRKGIGCKKNIFEAMWLSKIELQKAKHTKNQALYLRTLLQIAKIFEDSNHERESELIINKFTPLTTEPHQEFSKIYIFYLANWLEHRSKNYRGFFIIACELYMACYRIKSLNNEEQIVHIRAERKLSKLGREYHFLTEKNLKLEIQTFFQWGSPLQKESQVVLHLLDEVIKKDTTLTTYYEDTIKIIDDWMATFNNGELLKAKVDGYEKSRDNEDWNKQKNEFFLRFKKEIHNNPDLRRIKSSEVEVLPEKELEFFEGVKLGACRLKDSNQFLRFFKIKLDRQKLLEHILRNMRYMEIYHPFLINFYGIEVEIKTVRNKQNLLDKKKRTSIFNKSDQSILELIVYCDYFEEFVFQRYAIEEEGVMKTKVKCNKFWLDNTQRPDNLIQIMYQMICGLDTFHGVGKPYHLLNPYHLTIASGHRPKLLVPFFMEYFQTPLTFFNLCKEDPEIYPWYSPETYQSDQLTSTYQELLVGDNREERNRNLAPDIWSLGIFLLACLTSSDFIRDVIHESIVAQNDLMKNKIMLGIQIQYNISKISDNWVYLRNLIERMISQDPKERPTSLEIKRRFEVYCFRESIEFVALNKIQIQRMMCSSIVMLKDKTLKSISTSLTNKVPKMIKMLLPKNTIYKGKALGTIPEEEGSIYKNRKRIMRAFFTQGIPIHSLVLLLEDSSLVRFEMNETFPTSATFKIKNGFSNSIVEIKEFEPKSWIPKIDLIIAKIKKLFSKFDKEKDTSDGNNLEMNSSLLEKFLSFTRSSLQTRYNGNIDKPFYMSLFDPFGGIFRIKASLKAINVRSDNAHKKEDIESTELHYMYSKGMVLQSTEMDKIHKYIAIDREISKDYIFVSKLNFSALLNVPKPLRSFEDIYSTIMAHDNPQCCIIDYYGNYFEGSSFNGRIGVGRIWIRDNAKINLQHGRDDYFYGEVNMPNATYKGELFMLKKNGFGRLFDAKDFLQYEGYFHNNLPNGLGIIFSKDGIQFKGIFKAGVPHYGTFVQGEFLYEGSIKYINYLQGKEITIDNLFGLNSNSANLVILGSRFNNKDASTKTFAQFSGTDLAINGKVISQSNNGDIFKGELERNQRSGPGILIDSNGNIYDGEWKDNSLYGKFTASQTPKNQVLDVNSAWRIKAKGFFKYSETSNKLCMSDLGISINSDGSIYRGRFFNDKYSGEGRLTFQNGTYYKGFFNEGSFNGYGEYYDSENKTIYRGEFKDNNKHGVGMLSIRGEIFRGYFSNGKMLSCYFNNDFITKNFEENQKTIAKLSVQEIISEVFYIGHKTDYEINGFAKVRLSGGFRYEGEVFHDEISGYGRIQKKKDGRLVDHYLGEFKEQMFEGLGRKITKDVIYEGIFVEGLENGIGKLKFSRNNEEILGCFKKGRMHGLCIHVKDDIVVEYGFYQDGKKDGIFCRNNTYLEYFVNGALRLFVKLDDNDN